jgi:three-Cys-motif partner protein
MSTLWPLEPATEAKHRLYRCYLDAWWAKLLQAKTPTGSYVFPRVTYVDAFAGPGRYEEGEDGSPVIALKRLLDHQRARKMGLTRKRVRIIFIEGKRSRYEHLCDELTSRFGPLDQLPVCVDVRHGDAAKETTRALNEHSSWGQSILAVFDSWRSEIP